jgi:phospholipase/lecithinase/hemolysin/uncharacterized protein YhjY with autotransporter beta-barrel domain
MFQFRLKQFALFLFMPLLVQADDCCSNTCHFKNITAFGDSYTDIGNAPARPESICPGSSGSYAPDTNPGCRIWIQGVAKDLCTIIRPSSQGGTDYAVSAAAVTTAAQVLAQAQAYVNNPNAPLCNNLFAVRPSIQDFINTIVINNAVPTTAAIESVVDTTVQTITTLHDAGACYIIMPNMINLGNLPIFVVDGPAEQAVGTQVSTLFNAELLKKTNELCFDVIQVDAFGLEKEVFDHPCCFGFSNLTVGCCCPCPLSGTPAPDCCSSYYWDLLDQSGKAHKLFSDYVVSVLKGPHCFATMAEIPLEALYAHNATLEQQLPPLRSLDVSCPTFFLSSNYCPLLQQPTEKCCSGKQEKAASFCLLTGGIYPFSEQSLGGISYGFSRPKSKHDSCCAFDTMMHTVSLFGSYATKCYYANVIANGSYFKSNMQRFFNLGSKHTTASGSTHGNQGALLAQGAYFFIEHDTIGGGLCSFGLLGLLEYSRTKTYGYKEHNAGSANLTYNNFVRKSAMTGLGLEITVEKNYCSGQLIVDLFSVVQKDWKLHKHDVKFHVSSLPCSHAKIPLCLPFSVIMNSGLDVSFTGTDGMIAALGFHAKIGAKKYYSTVFSGSLGWNF